MKIVITGGAGYLGSVLTPELLKLGHDVTVLDTFIFRQTSLADCCGYETFKVVNGDCRGLDDARAMLEANGYPLFAAGIREAKAFKLAVESGRMAWEARLARVSEHAEASSPLTAFLD